jgi:hypothetical protein
VVRRNFEIHRQRKRRAHKSSVVVVVVTMAPLRPPSRLEPVSVPIFAVSWFVPDTQQRSPNDSASSDAARSIVAYCGGGGSAKTGIANAVFVEDSTHGRRIIPTGDDIGVGLQVYQHPVSGNLWLVVCVQSTVRRYALPSGDAAGAIDLGEEVSAVTMHGAADHVAIGCESGKVLVFHVSDEEFDDSEQVFFSDIHKKAVCSMAFSERGGRLMTCAKDGTACIFQGPKLVSGLKCSVVADNDPPPVAGRVAPQVIVKGCAFLDPDGRFAVTVASPRRGKAYIARWAQGPEDQTFSCMDRRVCSDYPISSFHLAADKSLLALGGSDGSVMLWDVASWKVAKTFNEVHDFPVTCIATRPCPWALQGEEDGVRVDARSASADGKMGCLTRQWRGPKKSSSGLDDGIGVVGYMNRIIYALLLAWFLSPVWKEYTDKCGQAQGFAVKRQCLLDDVLLAPTSRTGVSIPPY